MCKGLGEHRSHEEAPQDMSTERAERATGHAAVSAGGVTQHTKKNGVNDKLETTRNLTIRCYAAVGRLNGGVRGLFGAAKSPRLKASPSDDLESYVVPTSPPRYPLEHLQGVTAVAALHVHIVAASIG